MRISLALGSGGARGYAHIGVIEELHVRGHEITAIAGSSMGAVVGGLEAAGALPRFTDWVRQLTQRDVLKLLDPAFTGPGALWGQRVMDRVEEMLAGATIESLPIPFIAVATDLTARREVWFQHGPVAMAMRASIGIPSVFTPVMINGRLLADGALLNPVPVDALSGYPADLTLAVSLSGRTPGVLNGAPLVASSEEFTTLERWTERVRRGVLDAEPVRGIVTWLTGVRPTAGTDVASTIAPGPGEPASEEPATPRILPKVTEFDDLPRDLRTTDVVAMALETAEALITRFRTAANPPDVLVSVPQNAASILEFHRAAEIIELGRGLAARALDEAGL